MRSGVGTEREQDIQTSAGPSASVTRSPGHPATLPPCRHKPSPYRRLVEITCLVICGLLLFRAIGVEPYGVPTGSMAPALLGNHKHVRCPRCGQAIEVGLREHGTADHDSAVCPNCGSTDVSLAHAPTLAGDHLLVNKNVFDWRSPRRWEMVVFRCPIAPGRTFVKRVVALPGETVQVRDGDVLIDHELARKTLAEFKAVRIPLYNYNTAPREGWLARWEVLGGSGVGLNDRDLSLLTAREPERYQWLTYCNRTLEGYKARPLSNEYSYNGSDAAQESESVHDFQMECDLEVRDGRGWVALCITDGRDDLLVELPVGTAKSGARLAEAPTERSGSQTATEKTLRAAPTFCLAAGKTHHVELAFVDRRLTLLVDGVSPFAPKDLPAVEKRGEVVRPVRLGARGVDVHVRNFRLFRDIHYTEVGRHAIRAAVRLGAGEYFVLGDNSPSSDDNRFWSDAEGRPVPVAQANLLGKPFLVHMPSRIVHWEALGEHWDFQGLDWGRVRWLR